MKSVKILCLLSEQKKNKKKGTLPQQSTLKYSRYISKTAIILKVMRQVRPFTRLKLSSVRKVPNILIKQKKKCFVRRRTDIRQSAKASYSKAHLSQTKKLPCIPAAALFILQSAAAGAGLVGACFFLLILHCRALTVVRPHDGGFCHLLALGGIALLEFN